MNFIYISPQFPDYFYKFVQELKNRGFRVLGIGEDPYEKIPQQLKEALTEYYVCYGMDYFDNEVRAVQYFRDKYGPIDFIESNKRFVSVRHTL